jgi:RNA recognition motif-containing protein
LERTVKIYVGNLALDTSEAELRAMFEPHGEVSAVRLAKDKETGEPRGFGFVRMEDGPARAAISALHGTGERPRKVGEAKQRPPREG